MNFITNIIYQQSQAMKFRSLKKEVRGFIFLGESVTLKGFAVYLLLMTALLTNNILNKSFDFYQSSPVQLTLNDILHFVLSPQGALFLGVLALVILSHYLVMPVAASLLYLITRFLFWAAGNLFFYSVYFVLTKILRLNAERKFTIINIYELMNYLLYIVRVCHYYNGHVVRNRNFDFYRWYVTHLLSPYSNSVKHVYLFTSTLLSTWIVLHQYRFFELAPALYYVVTGILVFQLINVTVVGWITNDHHHFRKLITDSVSLEDSLKLPSKTTE